MRRGKRSCGPLHPSCGRMTGGQADSTRSDREPRTPVSLETNISRIPGWREERVPSRSTRYSREAKPTDASPVTSVESAPPPPNGPTGVGLSKTLGSPKVERDVTLAPCAVWATGPHDGIDCQGACGVPTAGRRSGGGSRHGSRTNRTGDAGVTLRRAAATEWFGEWM